MRYTRLRLTATGIVLGAYHQRRLGLDTATMAAWRRFAQESAPGVWSVWVDAAGDLRAEVRGASGLRDGLPVRHAPSPVADAHGWVPKTASPSPYDAVRRDDVVTLLTSRDGTEIYEACRAAVLGWDGERLVVVPADRPRVWSTAEAAVREHLPVREVPLWVTSDTPLLLVNAIAGTCVVEVPGRAAFPGPWRREIEALFARLTAWPPAGTTWPVNSTRDPV